MRRVFVLIMALVSAIAVTTAPAVASPSVTAPGQLIGGDMIMMGVTRCVVGFNARTGSGVRHVVSAGGCGGYGGAVVAPAGTVSTPYVRGPNGTLITINGVSAGTVGVQVCMFGPVGGFRCGTLTALNQTVNFGGGQVITGLIRTNICAYPGETGSPLFRVNGGRTAAIGVLVGGSGTCPSGGTTYFTPVGPILAAYGLTLYTG